MVQPTKPTVPAPPLRSQPDTFSERMEASLLFWPTFADYLDEVGTFTSEEAARATAAAAAGNLSDLDFSIIAADIATAGATSFAAITINDQEQVGYHIITPLADSDQAVWEAGTETTPRELTPAHLAAAVAAQSATIRLGRFALAADAAFLDVDLDFSDYDRVDLTLYGFAPRNNLAQLRMRFLSSPGTPDTTNGRYSHRRDLTAGGGGGGNNSDSNINLYPSAWDATNFPEGIGGNLTITKFPSAYRVRGLIDGAGPDGDFEAGTVAGRYNQSTAVGVRLLFDSGDIAAGAYVEAVGYRRQS